MSRPQDSALYKAAYARGYALAEYRSKNPQPLLSSVFGDFAKKEAARRAAEAAAAEVAAKALALEVKRLEPRMNPEVPLSVRELVAAFNRETGPGAQRRRAARLRFVSRGTMQEVWHWLHVHSAPERWEPFARSLLNQLEIPDWLLKDGPVLTRQEREQSKRDVRAAIKQLRLHLPLTNANHLGAGLKEPLDAVLAALDGGDARAWLLPAQVRDGAPARGQRGAIGKLRDGARRTAYCRWVENLLRKEFGPSVSADRETTRHVATIVEKWTNIPTTTLHVRRSRDQPRATTSRRKSRKLIA